MKALKYFSILSIGIIIIATLLSSQKKNGTYSEKSIKQINVQFQSKLNNFEAKLFTFEKLLNSDFSSKEVFTSYKNLRKVFKKTGLYIAYLDPEANDRFLNGAPLLKIMKKTPELSIVEPKGMQVIDELMGENIKEEEIKKELQQKVSQLIKNYKNIKLYVSRLNLTDRQVFELIRQELIRITTLGITGFDTPGTLLGIADAKSSFSEMKMLIQAYESEMRNINRIDLYKETIKQFEEGIQQLNKDDFNSFNRLIFIKKVINPLYGNIKKMHFALGYETIDEVYFGKKTTNYEVENLFEKNFVNKEYFTTYKVEKNHEKVVELGKLLFNDPILSSTKKMACVSCHHADKAFTDGQKTSISNAGEFVKRNSPTLNYAIFATKYLHDLRADRLEDQYEHVITNPDEFNSSYQQIIKDLNTSPTYQKMFSEAFENKEISTTTIDHAITAFIMDLTPFDNDIDLYFQNKKAVLKPEIKRGFNLFTGKAACATCHFIPLYNGTVPPAYLDTESEVLGVPKTKENQKIIDEDLGRYGNKRPKEHAIHYKNSFKTPTLRNIANTAPYMHNGVFNTLEEVMEFYNNGGGAGQGMDVENQTLSDAPLNLSEQEISDIIAFMKALSDKKQFDEKVNLPTDFPNKSWNQRKVMSNY
ncbi:cytochrome-c peroxidase [Aureivirga marina]|uniref:cytochrome-c peroxidase n=1 Tax=Aureivirga marina TaxID=1182451 RepID=UPI0018CA09B2|nr:cytochrome c peroxidase [Aureivirga marina]